MEKPGILNKLVKVFDPKKPAPLPLPDNGGSFTGQDLNSNSTVPISTPSPHLVEIFVASDLRGGDRLSGDWKKALDSIQACKTAGLDTETIISNILKDLGYPINRYTLKTIFQEADLHGGLSVGASKAISFRKMEGGELADALKQIGSGEQLLDDEQIRLSKALQNVKFEVVSFREIPGEGIKALIVTKEKDKLVLEEPQGETKIEITTQTETIKTQPEEFDISSSPFLKGPGKYWSNN